MSDEFNDYEGLELGCGSQKEEGFLGVDKFNTKEADVIHDLDETPWPLPQNNFSKINALDVIEHVEKPVQFIEEIHRVAEQGAEVIIRAPHQSSQNWNDLTHKRLLGYRSIENFFTEEGTWSQDRTQARFKIISRELTFKDYPLSRLGKRITEWNPHIYENTFLSRLFPAMNIKFVMKVQK